MKTSNKIIASVLPPYYSRRVNALKAGAAVRYDELITCSKQP
ncbi:MAG: hypothetical protein ACLTTW_03950 [Coprobacter sp.]